jgi:DNA topoisomerase-3
METAGRFVEDEELRQAMKDSGLGTPATRAATIERLLEVRYLAREGKVLVPTEKGRALISLLGDSPIASPELTASWEERLSKMERAAEDRPTFMNDIKNFATKLVEEVRVKEGEKLAAPARRAYSKNGKATGKADGKPQTSTEPLGACPKCGAPVVETQKAFGCSAWKSGGCKFAIWKTVSGKRLSAAQARQLLTTGRTGKLKGFKTKAGKPYAATLILDAGHKVRPEFGE